MSTSPSLSLLDISAMQRDIAPDHLTHCDNTDWPHASHAHASLPPSCCSGRQIWVIFESNRVLYFIDKFFQEAPKQAQFCNDNSIIVEHGDKNVWSFASKISEWRQIAVDSILMIFLTYQKCSGGSSKGHPKNKKNSVFLYCQCSSTSPFPLQSWADTIHLKSDVISEQSPYFAVCAYLTIRKKVSFHIRTKLPSSQTSFAVLTTYAHS